MNNARLLFILKSVGSRLQPEFDSITLKKRVTFLPSCISKLSPCVAKNTFMKNDQERSCRLLNYPSIRFKFIQILIKYIFNGNLLWLG